MAGQDKVLGKSKLGRPAIGKGVQINSSFRPEDVAALDRWIAAQPEPQPGRPEAIRYLLRDSLTGLGYLPSDPAEPTPAAPHVAVIADRYADADPNEAVMVTGVGPMILHRAVRKRVDWREHHGLPLVSVFRGADKQPSVFDMVDLGRLAEMERFR